MKPWNLVLGVATMLWAGRASALFVHSDTQSKTINVSEISSLHPTTPFQIIRARRPRIGGGFQHVAFTPYAFGVPPRRICNANSMPKLISEAGSDFPWVA